MTERFTFNAYDVGQPSQHIIFKLGDEPEQKFAVPDLVIPTDANEKFRCLYDKLVELHVIPNRTGIFRP